MYATSDDQPAVTHTDFFKGRPMDHLLTDRAIDDLVADFIADAATTLPQSTSHVHTLVARHRLSDEEPDADEVDAVDEDDDDDDDDDWEDDDDDDWDDDDDDVVADPVDDDDDDDWDDDDDDDDDDWDDDDDDETPANIVKRIFARTAVRS